MKRIIIITLFSLLVASGFSQKDTTYNLVRYERVSQVVNFYGETKSSRIDSINFQGSFIKAKKINQVLYLPTIDTLILLEDPQQIGKFGLSILLWKFTNKAWATYFSPQTGMLDDIRDNSEWAEMVLNYPFKYIPEKGVPQQFWDHEEKTIFIWIIKKQATYSN